MSQHKYSLDKRLIFERVLSLVLLQKEGIVVLMRTELVRKKWRA